MNKKLKFESENETDGFFEKMYFSFFFSAKIACKLQQQNLFNVFKSFFNVFLYDETFKVLFCNWVTRVPLIQFYNLKRLLIEILEFWR